MTLLVEPRLHVVRRKVAGSVVQMRSERRETGGEAGEAEPFERQVGQTRRETLETGDDVVDDAALIGSELGGVGGVGGDRRMVAIGAGRSGRPSRLERCEPADSCSWCPGASTRPVGRG